MPVQILRGFSLKYFVILLRNNPVANLFHWQLPVQQCIKQYFVIANPDIENVDMFNDSFLSTK